MTKKNMSFEASLLRLEEILRALENGEIELDDMLKLYEEGIGLIRGCNQQLENAEQKVKMISLQSNGEVVLSDFNQTEEL